MIRQGPPNLKLSFSVIIKESSFKEPNYDFAIMAYVVKALLSLL